MNPVTAEKIPDSKQKYGHVVRATIWFGNPYMPWHDPQVPGGKWGQQLIINENGHCQSQAFVFNQHRRRPIDGQAAEELQMAAEEAPQILHDLVSTLNYCGRLADDDEDYPNRYVDIQNDAGEHFVFVDFDDTEPLAIGRLSMKIRDQLNRADLLVMDGRGRDDFIEQLTMTFIADDNYGEKLTLSRNDEAITYQRWESMGTDITTTYHLPDNVSAILDNLNQADFTETIPGLPDDAMDDNGQFGHFTCTLTQRNLKPIRFGGDYEKYSLPENWPGLMEVLHNMMDIPVLGVLLSADYFGKRRRRTSDVIYLSVNFGRSNHEYNYLTDDDSIQVGDYVVVPVSEDNDQQVVEVTAKNYYQPNEVPYPLDRVKKVIGKADDDDGQSAEEL
ncbi:hypothetical protein [uncultured Limosilactobacillus sp.]|uniref:hypothetical protein n=1 Tax=uncultured Limosilactobacillus sp. TaxID=2837629 RepID=UPI0026012405|nr:hypothetical protein [uncultured Limosilactobacillus sp.]